MFRIALILIVVLLVAVGVKAYYPDSTGPVTVTKKGFIPPIPPSLTVNGMGGTKHNNPGADNVYSALNYGDFTYDDVSIQAAVNAASAAATATSVPTVYIPSGTYFMHYPLILTDNNSGGWFPTIRGASGYGGPAVPGSTVLYAKNAINTGGGEFPVVMIVPTDYVSSLGTITASALVGSGNSLQFNTGKPFWLSLSELTLVEINAFNPANYQPLNGLGAFTLQMYFNTTSASTTQTLLQSSNPTRNTAALYLGITSGGQIAASLNTGGSIGTITGGSISANTTYWVALTYTGSHIYLYVSTPGATGQTPVASAVATGNVTQTIDETMSLGGDSAGWPANGGIQNPYVGKVDSVDLDNTALYNGGSVTAPSAKFSSAVSTLYLNNFTTITPTANGVTGMPLISVDAIAGRSDSGVTAYNTINNGTYEGNSKGPLVEDIQTFAGTTGWWLNMVPFTYLSRLTSRFPSYTGYFIGNNSYFSVLRDLSADASGVAGYLFGWSVSVADRLTAGATPYGIVCGQIGCGDLVHPSIGPGSNSIAAIYQVRDADGQFGVDNIIDAAVDNEASGNGIALEIGQEEGQVLVEGGTWISRGTAPAIQCDGSCNLTVVGGQYFAGSSATSAINFGNLAASPAPAVSTFNMVNEFNIPLSNNPAWVSIYNSTSATVPQVASVGTLQLLTTAVPTPAATPSSQRQFTILDKVGNQWFVVANPGPTVTPTATPTP